MPRSESAESVPALPVDRRMKGDTPRVVLAGLLFLVSGVAALVYQVTWQRLPPTVLMGMSLPFLVRAVVTDVEGAGRRIGWLYGINVLGAAAGAFATPWLLLPAVGVRGAVLVASAANGLVGLRALVLVRLPRPGRDEPSPAPFRPPSSPAPSAEEAPGGRPPGREHRGLHRR